jgi:hypothetical protein
MLERARKYVAPVLLAGIALFYANEIWRSSKGTHPPAPQARAEHPQYEAKHDNIFSDAWNWTTQDAVSFYTSMLALFTGALVTVSAIQIRFLIRADISARRSAIAARRAADASIRQARIAETALTQLERPHMFIWGIRSSVPSMVFTSSTRPNDEPKVVRDNAHFNYSVSNGGKLAGVIETVSIACGYERNGRIPPLHIIGDHYLLGTPIVSSGQNVLDIPYKIPLAELDRADPRPYFRDDLIFRVVIEYRGPVTRDHETSQCWRYRTAVNGWAEDPRYTYSRQRNEGAELDA